MTKAKMIESADGKKAEPAKPAAKAGKRLHLRSIHTEQAEDGSLVHHHTYADSKDAKFPHPTRTNAATSATPEEAGQHIAEMFGQNGMTAAPAAGEGDGAAPAPAAQPGAAPAQEPPEE